MRVKATVLAVILSAAPGMLHAQFNFKLGGRTVQFRSFASQGFAYTTNNNYLTMKTSDGSFAMTDAGATVGMAITDRFRVETQVYLRNIGELGQWRPELSWAYGDYRFADWFGVRAGKVKTALGLYYDTQDREGLHTWAMLPQSVYALDLRGNSIAHIGVDFYGEIPAGVLGSFNYTGYVGARTFDTRGGYYYAATDQGLPIDDVSGRATGGDLRWDTPLKGLMAGASFMDQTQSRRGHYGSLSSLTYDYTSDPQHTLALYADYVRGRWRFSSELRKSNYIGVNQTHGFPMTFRWDGSDKGWFGSAAFRVSKWLELGTYHSRYSMGHPASSAEAGDHIYDQTVTARLDVNRYWNFKVEGHFMDGYGDLYSPHGFYTRSNPAGLQPKTRMLVVRTGFTF